MVQPKPAWLICDCQQRQNRQTSVFNQPFFSTGICSTCVPSLSWQTQSLLIVLRQWRKIQNVEKVWRDTVVGVGCVADVLERERFHLCLAHLRQALRRQRAPAKANTPPVISLHPCYETQGFAKTRDKDAKSWKQARTTSRAGQSRTKARAPAGPCARP